nr:endonuclease/exonuclease/phosphatase family protein [Sphingomonas oleivorans]
MEHLAERDGMGCRPRRQADYAALRGYADRLGADVIALQEVESRAAAERVFLPERYTVIMSKRPDSGRGGGCYGKKGLAIRKQDVGFAIRKGVPFTRNPDVSDLGLGNPDLRWGVDITLGTPKPIRLLALHLKSGCNSGHAPSDRDCDVLFAQLPVVERWIDARISEGVGFAILGDWNRRLASRKDAFWSEIDRPEQPEADLVLADAGQRASCKSRYHEFIDHIVLDPKAVRRMVPAPSRNSPMGCRKTSIPRTIAPPPSCSEGAEPMQGNFEGSAEEKLAQVQALMCASPAPTTDLFIITTADRNILP